jgi:Gly-Xaa carboxypeptidase
VDIINGGAKVNALPERVTATVNHRVNVGEHPSQVHDKVTKLAKEVAKKYNLTLHAFDDVEAPSSISLYASSDHTLEPAPVTPTSGDVWDILSGTTKGLYPDVIMAPGIMVCKTFSVHQNLY